jgi:hypothetical protein
MTSRHLDRMDPSAKVCLARYCGVFRCRERDTYTNPGRATRAEEKALRDARAKERRDGLERNARGSHCSENDMLRQKLRVDWRWLGGGGSFCIFYYYFDLVFFFLTKKKKKKTWQIPVPGNLPAVPETRRDRRRPRCA